MPVLVAIDGSSHTEVPLRLGAQIARRGHEPLTILTVVKHEADHTPDPVDVILARACELVQPQVPDVRTRVRIGHPATEIVREAEDGQYDLVIVGERPDRNLVARFLLGSTAVRVVEHASCPVIVAKGKIGPIQRILLCDSGSGDPSVGLSSASHPPTILPSASLGAGGAGPSVLSRFIDLPVDLLDGSGEIVVLHVMSQMSAGPGVKGKQLRSGTEELFEERAPEGELLQRDIEALDSLGIHARARVRHGLVVEEIQAEVHSEDYDLVVIGAYRGEGWQRILLDDLAHRLVVELDRPVLVVR
jgi:nucleotide-binding universal stress UspA family protein